MNKYFSKKIDKNKFFIIKGNGINLNSIKYKSIKKIEN